MGVGTYDSALDKGADMEGLGEGHGRDGEKNNKRKAGGILKRFRWGRSELAPSKYNSMEQYYTNKGVFPLKGQI